MIYGSMDQDARTMNLRLFRNGEVQYLIVTDVAARGIDIPMLHNVINFHFPPNPKLFVHRCGRAGRQGRIGYAFSLVEPEELAYMFDVMHFLNQPLSNGYDTVKASDVLQEIGNGNGNDEDDDSDDGDVDGVSISKETKVHTGVYSLPDMTPDMIHTGLLAQDALDTENEYVKRTVEVRGSVVCMVCVYVICVCGVLCVVCVYIEPANISNSLTN